MNAPDADTVVCFDLGGVVVRIARDWQEGCAAAGIDVRDPDRFHEPTIKANRRELAHAYQLGNIACDAFFAGIADNTAGLYSADDVRAVHRAWILGDEPGVERLITEINATPGLRTACLSNTNHDHWQRDLRGNAERRAPSPAFAQITTTLASHELRLAKPDPAIYAAAEECLGAPPERIVFFDDLPENVAAARERGWNAHHIDHAAPTAPQMRRALAALDLVPHTAQGATQ